MKRTVLYFLCQAVFIGGYSQDLSFKFGTPFRRADLDVRWSVVSNAVPQRVWVYRLLPRNYASDVLANLLAIGSFTAKDKTHADGSTMLFESPDKSRSLWISSKVGAIRYQTAHTHGPTNLSHGVPTEAQAVKLAKSFLVEIGISLADIEKTPDGNPNFRVHAGITRFFVNHTTITNTEFRSVGFRRSVEGAPFIGNGAGGDGEIRFGDDGRITRIWISWRHLERHKDYPTAPPEKIMNWIKKGQAVQGMLPMDAEPIEWKTVKSLTITRADLCYYGGGPFDSSDWLIPYVALWTTVDTGHSKTGVEIDCPIIAKP